MDLHVKFAFLSRTRRIVMALILFSLLATGLIGPSYTKAADESSRAGAPVVGTDDGPVRGFMKNGVYEFLGIPYAAPPVGELRWRPPQRAKQWSEVRDATHFGNTCPQVDGLGVFAGPPSITEDCLFLNVFTSNNSSRDQKKPVLVWIYGGAHVAGESNDYDGSKLATGGALGSPTVVVTLNYRLGLFGFLSHPALDSEGHPFANYGTLDIQAVLHWVQRNIAAFGGDPTRVTLGGQSAGAIEAGATLVSPLAAGLFHGAILQSAPYEAAGGPFFWAISDARSNGMKFAVASGCAGRDATTAECLRKLSVQRILQFQGTPRSDSPFTTGAIIDGTIIPELPQNAFAEGKFNRVPILAGTTHDEITFVNAITQYFSGPAGQQVPLTAEQYTKNVNDTFSPGKVAKILTEYQLAKYASPQIAWSAVVTDYMVSCQGRHAVRSLSKWVPVYQYEFNYQGAPFYFPEMPGFTALASHTIDIQFLFPDYHGGILGVNSRPLNADEMKLSDQMVASWTTFVRTGNPNGSGNSPWPRYSTRAGEPAIWSQNSPVSDTTTDANFAADHHCELWDSVRGY